MAMSLKRMITLGYLILAEAAKKVEEPVKVDTTNGFVAAERRSRRRCDTGEHGRLAQIWQR